MTDRHKLPVLHARSVYWLLVGKHMNLVIAGDGARKLANKCNKRISDDLPLREIPFPYLVLGSTSCQSEMTISIMTIL